MSDYTREWRSYRLRFRTAAAAWLVPPVLIYLSRIGGRLGIWLIAAWLLFFTASMMWLYSFRCPRCGQWFFIRFPINHPLARACVHCGLLKHALSDPGGTEAAEGE